jgi:PDZ domain-containing secreted protein
MIKTLKKYIFVLPIYFLFFIFIAVIGLVKVDYNLLAPAVNDDGSTFIYGPSEYEPEGSFHTTSGVSVDEVTILQRYVGSWLD